MKGEAVWHFRRAGATVHLYLCLLPLPTTTHHLASPRLISTQYQILFSVGSSMPWTESWPRTAQIAGMFVRFFENDQIYAEADGDVLQKDAKEFGDLVAPQGVSMARVQGFLNSFMRKENPAKAVLRAAPTFFLVAGTATAKPAGTGNYAAPPSISETLYSLPTVNSCEEDERVLRDANWVARASQPEALRRAISVPAAVTGRL